MKYLGWMGGLCLLFFSATLKANGLAASDIEAVRALLSRHSVAAMPYCSGYHCYHQAMDLCERVGPQQCRVAEVGVLRGTISGHGNVILRLGRSTHDVYCLANPQNLSRRLDERFCWAYPASAAPPESYWIPPANVQQAYCLVQKIGCAQSGHTDFRISQASNMDGQPYAGWWKNTTHSNGQIMRLCDTKNMPAHLGRLPSKMPECSTLVGRACPNSEHAVACRHLLRCQIIHCTGRMWVWSDWRNLPLPYCRTPELLPYCQRWQRDTSRTAEATVQNNFIAFHTQHFCRAENGIRAFWCHPQSGATFNPKGFRNELSAPGR